MGERAARSWRFYPGALRVADDPGVSQTRLRLSVLICCDLGTSLDSGPYSRKVDDSGVMRQRGIQGAHSPTLPGNGRQYPASLREIQ